MLARIIQIIFFTIMLGAPSSATIAAHQTLPEAQQQNPKIPINPCNDVANKIKQVSKSKTETKVYAWEDLSWLEKNLGSPDPFQVKGKKGYMWVCTNSTGNIISMVWYYPSKQGESQTTYQSMMCPGPKGTPCKVYGFERDGSNIRGFVKE